MARSRKKEQPKEQPYRITLAVNGEKRVSAGETFEAALLHFPPLTKLVTKGVMTYEHDSRTSKPILLNIQQMRRLFFKGASGDVERIVLAKRFKLLGGI